MDPVRLVPIDRFIGEFFRSAQQAIARIADDHIHPAMSLKGTLDDDGNALDVDQIKLDDIQSGRVILPEPCQGFRATGRRYYCVTFGEQLLRHLEAKSRRGAGNEPCLLHRNPPFEHARCGARRLVI